MNVETIAGPNSIHKGKRTKNKHKFKKNIYKKFDFERFIYAWGFALALAVVGILIIYSVKTPAGISESIGSPNYQSLSEFHPETTIELLAFVVGSLLLLSAVFCIFLGLKIVAQFIAGKKLKFGKKFKSHFRKNRFHKLLSDKTSNSK